MMRFCFKKLLVSTALITTAFASGEGDLDLQMHPTVTAVAGPSTAVAQNQDLDLQARAVMGNYDLFFGYKEFLRNNPEEIKIAMDNRKRASELLKGDPADSENWKTGLTIHLMELVKGSTHALEYIAKNTWDFAAFMPNVFGGVREKHWQDFYADFKNISEGNQLTKEVKLIEKLHILNRLYNSTPQKEGVRNAEDRSFYTDRALGLISKAEWEEKYDNFVVAINVMTAIMTFGEHFGTPYTPFEEKQRLLHHPKMPLIVSQTLRFFEKFGNFMDDVQKRNLTSILTGYALIHSYSESGDRESNFRKIIDLMNRFANVAPESEKARAIIISAALAKTAHRDLPDMFPLNLQENPEWVQAARSILANKNKQIEDRSVLAHAAQIQLSAMQGNKDAGAFLLRMEALSVLIEYDNTPGNKIYWNEHKKIELAMELVRLENDAKRFQEVIRFIEADTQTPDRLKKQDNKWELIAFLLRGAIKQDGENTLPLNVHAVNIYVAGLESGFIKMDLKGKPLTPETKFPLIADLMVKSNQEKHRKKVYEMLMSCQIEPAILPIEGPWSARSLTEEFRLGDPYERSLFHYHRFLVRDSDPVVELSKAFEYLEQCPDNDATQANKEFLSGLLEKYAKPMACTEYEDVPVAAPEDASSGDSDSQEDSDGRQKKIRKSKWKVSPEGFVKSLDRIRQELEQSKLPSVNNMIRIPEALSVMGVMEGDLAAQDFAQLSRSQKLVLQDKMNALREGESLRGLETLNGHKRVDGVPLDLLQKGLIKAVPIEGVHRLVFSQQGKSITVYRCHGHYDDNISGVNQ